MTKLTTCSEKLIQIIDDHHDFVTGDDGYVMFWPSGSNGGFSEWMLRAIADELDKRNADWDKQVHDYFEKEENI